MALAGYLPPVVAEVIAEVGKYSAGMGQVKAEMSSLEAATTKMAAAGKMAMVGLAVGVAAVGFESVKLAMNFDQTMELIHTQAGASQAEVEQLKQKVLELAPAVGIGPAKLAEGLYHIESTGMRGVAAMDVLKEAAKLAAIGMADLDDVTYAMSGVMSVGMKDVTNAADAISYMNATVGMGDMRMDALARAIGTGVLPSFKSAGLGMKDFSAALATIADNSVPADEAATRLRMTVALMSAPSMKAAGALQSIGIGATQLADDMRGPNGLLTAVMDLKTHLEESGKTASEQNAVIEEAFGGGRTSGAILTLLEETDRLKSKYEQLGTAESRAAATDEAWAQQQKQFSQQWHEFVATIQATGVKIGEWLIPKLQAMFEWINKNGEEVKALAIIIGGVLVVAIGAWTVALIQAAIANIAATWEIMLIIAAVVALVAGIYWLVKHWDTVWSFIKRIALDVWGWLVGAWHATINALAVAAQWVKTKVIDPVVNWFNHYLVAPTMALLRILSVAFQFAWGFMSVIIDDFVTVWNRNWAAITAVLTWAWENVIKPVFDFIVTYGVGPVIAAIGWLVDAWHVAWDAIKTAASWAWENVIKPVFQFIDTYGIQPLKAGISELGKIWDGIWEGIKKAVSAAWDFVKPIFDKIGGAISTIKGDIGAVINAPGEAGKAAAHMLGFAEGGTVPGPVGAPRLIVAHGGEQILSNDQLAAMGRGRVSALAGTGAGGANGWGDIIINQKIVSPEGKVLRDQQLRYARQAGISPADLYPASTTSLVRG